MTAEPGGAPSLLGERVVARCLDAGFAAAGVATLEPSAFEHQLRVWLAEGRHGTMDWLARHADLRANPALLLDGARAAVMVADLYASRADNRDEPLGPAQGRVARYARASDYHDAVKRRLHTLCDALRAEHPDAAFRAFVDTAPVPERELGARAALGWTGKHTLTIHPRLGSYVVLGGFMTTLDLAPPPEQRPVADHCGTCTRCIDACPTGAITPYAVDARRCVSYLTIEHRGPIDPELHEGVGAWLFGCDVCQEVCPHNSPRAPESLPPVGRRARPSYARGRDRFDLLDVLGWKHEDRARELAGTAMKRATLAMWRRNAVVVAGNALRDHDLPELRARLAAIAADPEEDEIVRHAARDALA